jgi:hypothetical protein
MPCQRLDRRNRAQRARWDCRANVYSLPTVVTPSDDQESIDRLILEAATSARQLVPDELRRVLDYVAAAGFVPNVLGEVGRRGAGVAWQGRVLKASDQLSAAEAHYVRHVLGVAEWPLGTSLQAYIDSIREVVLDSRSGVLTSRYFGFPHLTVLRRSRDLRGPEGFGWLLVEYRVGLGHWVTAFQPRNLVDAIRSQHRQDVRWLRRPQ